MPIKLSDAAEISGTRRTSEGYLIADAFVARSGIQTYLGSEVGMNDRATVRVYRPESEVRAVDAMRSYSHAPITLNHPSELVTKDNWAQLAKGEVSTEAVWQEDRIRLPLILKDGPTIDGIESGTRGLSAGYTCTIDAQPGTTPEGEAFDAVQRDIRINHVAVVPKGRAGEEFRIGDDAGKWGAMPVNVADERGKTMTLRKIMVDGLEVETTDAGAAAIKKLETAVSVADTKLTEATTAHETAITAKDEEIGKLKADLKKANDALPKAEDLDRMVADRSALVSTVAKIAKDVKPEGKTDAELRKAAVVARMGDEAVTEASDAEIKGMFRAIAADADKATEGDPVRGAMPNVKPVQDAATAENDAYNAFLADLNPEKKEA